MKVSNLRLSAIALLIAGIAFVGCNDAKAETLTGAPLVQHLRQGGYVILMRHAHSPVETPDKRIADADNPNLERQLDETGRNTARSMGEAIKKLHIPVGAVFSSTNNALLTSPAGNVRFGSQAAIRQRSALRQKRTCRAMQTVWLA